MYAFQFKFMISRGTSNVFSENNYFLLLGRRGGQTQLLNLRRKTRDVTQKTIRHLRDKKTFVTETNLWDRKNPEGRQFSTRNHGHGIFQKNVL